VEVLGQRLPVDGEAPAGPEVDVLVRPEAIHVHADAAGDARVVATAFLGSVVRLTVQLADSTEVKADLPAHEAAGLGAGVAVRVSLPERPVLVAERVNP
jgi:putative spermidine/putrescine transport system ATP-binding protein